MAALGITVGTVYWGQAVLQNALDAGSRAGAQEAMYNPSTAFSKAYHIIRVNDGMAQHILIESGQQYDATHPGAQMLPLSTVASAHESIPGGFANVFGIHQFHLSNVSASAANVPFSYSIFQGCRVPSPGNGHSSNGIALHFSGTNQNVATSEPVWVHSNNFITGGSNALVGKWQPTASQTTSRISPQPRFAPVTTLSVWTLPSLQQSGYTVITQSDAMSHGWLYKSGSGGYFTPQSCLHAASCTISGPLAINGNVRIHSNVGTLNLEGALVAYGNITFAGATSIGQSGAPPWILAAMPVSALSSRHVSPSSSSCTNNLSTITFDGATAFTNGAIYDPVGTIHLGGNSSTVTNSSIVGHFLSLSGGMKVTPPQNVPLLPTNTVQLVR